MKFPGKAPALPAGQTKSLQEKIRCASNMVPLLFAARAAETPSAVALSFANQQLTFDDVEISSNRMANYFRFFGFGPEVAVGICLQRSLEFVIAALAILKTGGAYVPLDPSYPPERLAFMLNDCNAQAVVTRGGMVQPLLGRPWQMIDLEASLPAIASSSPEHAFSPSPYSLAYVIYTSGSTGTPKGVQITHRNLSNLVEWHQQAFRITGGDRTSQVASLGFDAAVWELWPNLCSGATVYIADEETRNSASMLRDWILANAITVSFVPTPLAEQMFELTWPARTALRLLLTGGDALQHHPPPNLPFVVVNNYGPTECTVVAGSGVVEPATSALAAPDIGQPIANTHLIVVDEDLNPVPPGTMGELLIGGAGVGRGYCNRPDLTPAKFIPDFSSPEEGARLYRTGDLVTRLPNSRLAFLGRLDDQIKLHGFRIEPGEITSALNRYPGIRQSIVVARTHTGGKRLVAYVVAEHGSELCDSFLRQHLRRTLPEFMIPSVFVRITELPLTTNQKIDYSALPLPNEENRIRDRAPEHSEPRTLIEKQLTALLSELLGVAEVGARDNFFLLGGHSLLGAQLIACIRDTFDVELSLRQLFDNPTVAELAADVEQLLVARMQTLSADEIRSLCSVRNAE
jgi:amino acid adenylation domain-containing protein